MKSNLKEHVFFTCSSKSLILSYLLHKVIHEKLLAQWRKGQVYWEPDYSDTTHIAV